MKIAVAYENETSTVFKHFGHTKTFKLYDIKDNAVESSTLVNTPGSGHDTLSSFLKEYAVTALICGGIGAGAVAALSEVGIRIYAGVKGAADEAVADYLAGTLKYTTAANCAHHASSHHHADGVHRCLHAHDKN